VPVKTQRLWVRQQKRAILILGVAALATITSGKPALSLDYQAQERNQVYCNYPSNYYPGLCDGKQNATNSCAWTVAENSGDGEHPPIGAYVPASSSQYRVFVFQQTDLGCHYVGHRVVSFFQERRQGPSGPFARSSPAITIRTNRVLRFRKVLDIPYSCAGPGDANSAVRLDVHVSWVPDPGFGKVPADYEDSSTPIKWSTYSKVEQICQSKA
jgi:hypothetical protein